MTPLLGRAPSVLRGGVYWGNPTYPDGSGGSEQNHRCLVLRTPEPSESLVPILTLHSIRQKPRAISDCTLLFEAGAYGLKKPTMIDARMLMFAHIQSLRQHAFDLTDADMDEIDFCLLNALQLPADFD